MMCPSARIRPPVPLSENEPTAEERKTRLPTDESVMLKDFLKASIKESISRSKTETEETQAPTNTQPRCDMSKLTPDTAPCDQSIDEAPGVMGVGMLVALGLQQKNPQAAKNPRRFESDGGRDQVVDLEEIAERPDN